MFSPDDLINVALESLIEVEGLVHLDCSLGQLYDSSFKLSPLRPSRIPLYMAIHLQKRNKLKIIIPKEYTDIQSVISIEISNRDEFSMLPEYFYEVAHILKITNSDIDKLKQIRLRKIWDGLKKMDGKATYIRNLTIWEYNKVKRYITDSFSKGERMTNQLEND